MKLIDKTPFYNEQGQIGAVDRAKAMLKFGKSWVDEVEAQKSVLPVFEKNLDRSFTLLRNVEIPELGISIPFILVGPPGVLVIYVAAVKGMFRAKGDQWGTISGSVFKPVNPNLLVRAENMGRALQRYLQSKGYSEITSVEAILLCADPAVHVDSQRPIVRIVMRDALERFVISIPQARTTLSRETAQSVVDVILNPPAPPEESAEEAPAEESESDAGEEEARPEPASPPPFEVSPLTSSERPTIPPSRLPPRPAQRRRAALSTKQWIFLALMFLIWCCIMAGFVYMVAQDFFL